MHMGIITKLNHTKLVNYILEAIQENLLTLSSTAKVVTARIFDKQYSLLPIGGEE
jgi:hypothetical protein